MDYEGVRDRQRREWGAAARGWAERRDQMVAPARAVTEQLIAMSGVGPGQTVLDVACGVGDPALSIAPLVEPGGSVLGVDLTDEMVSAARGAAQRDGVSNVEFRVIESELAPGVGPGSVDAVTCRFGLMFMPDPVAALTAWHDTLRPGGRIAFSTWGPPEKVPFFSLVMQVIGRHIDAPRPDPSAPGPFALPSAEVHAAALRAAGFTDIATTAVETAVMESPDGAAWWEQVSATAGPIVLLLASLPDDAREAIRRDAIATLEEAHPERPISVGGQALVSAAGKPV